MLTPGPSRSMRGRGAFFWVWPVDDVEGGGRSVQALTARAAAEKAAAEIQADDSEWTTGTRRFHIRSDEGGARATFDVEIDWNPTFWASEAVDA